MEKFKEINRRNIIKESISNGLIFKFISMGISYISVPIVLNFLGVEKYGFWITIQSILNWIYNFDVGIGLGFRNKLTEAITKNNKDSASKFSSLAYISLTMVSFGILIIGIILTDKINIKNLLNIKVLTEREIEVIIYISLVSTNLNFILNLYKNVLYSLHKFHFVNLFNIINQLLIILMLVITKGYFYESVVLIALIFGISNSLVGVIANLIIFSKNNYLIPRFKRFHINEMKVITNSGLKFFIIQLSMIIIFTTDNIIITRFLGSEAVTQYDTALKIFKIFFIISAIILGPFWALFTDAYIKKDKDWIINSFNKFMMLYILMAIILMIVGYNLNLIIKLWIGRDLQIPNILIIFNIIFVLEKVYGDIYMTFLNSIGQIREQLLLYLIGALINIPMSILFITKFDMGAEGVLLATIISMIGLAVVMPIQAKRIVKKIKLI